MHRIDPTFRDAWERIKVRRAKAQRELGLAIAAEEAGPTRFPLHVASKMWLEGIDFGLMQAMDAMLEVEPTLFWNKTLPEVEPIPDPPPATWVTPVPLPKPVTREELATRLHAAAEEGVNELLDAIAPKTPRVCSVCERPMEDVGDVPPDETVCDTCAGYTPGPNE